MSDWRDKILEELDRYGWERFFDDFLNKPNKKQISNGFKNYYCHEHDDSPSGDPNLHVCIDNSQNSYDLGAYNCKKCGASGNLWTFLEEHASIAAGNKDKLKWLSEYLGVDKPRRYTCIEYDIETLESMEEMNGLLAHLLDVDEETVDRFNIKTIDDVTGEPNWVFPNFSMDREEVYYYKLRDQNLSSDHKYATSDTYKTSDSRSGNIEDIKGVKMIAAGKDDCDENYQLKGQKDTSVPYPRHLLEQNRSAKRIWVCEGETDCIRLWDQGEVAISGVSGMNTSTSDEVASWIINNDYNEVILAPDAEGIDKDEHDVRAAFARFRKNKLPAEMRVKKVFWKNEEDGFDVSDEILQNGIDSLIDRISSYPVERASEDLAMGGWDDLDGNRVSEIDGRLVSFRPGSDEPTEIASFTMRPQRVLQMEGDGKEDIFQVAVLGDDGECEEITLPVTLMNSESKFENKLDSHWMTWKGSSLDLKHLKEHLSKRAATVKTGLDVYGYWPEYDLFAFPGWIIDSDGPKRHSQFVARPHLETGWDEAFHKDLEMPDRELKKVVGQNLYNSHAEDLVYTAIPFWALSWVRKWFIEKHIDFPFYNLHGTSGSGKTSWVNEIISRLHGTIPKRVVNSASTMYAITSSVSVSCGPVMVLDEMKHDLGKSKLDTLRNFIREVHENKTERKGGGGDNHLDLVNFDYQSPMAVMGEMSVLTDTSMMERSIPVTIDRNELMGETGDAAQKAFHRLTSAPIHRVRNAYLTFLATLSEQNNIETYWRKAINDVESKTSNRKLRNQRMICMGAYLWNDFCDQEGIFCPDNFPALCTEKIREISEEEVVESLGRPKTDLDRFIEDLSAMASDGTLEPGTHYCTKGSELYIHIDSAHNRWMSWIRDMREQKEPVSTNAIHNFMQEEMKRPDGYVETNSDVRRWTDGSSRRTAIVNLNKLDTEDFEIDVSGFLLGDEEAEAVEDDGGIPI